MQTGPQKGRFGRFINTIEETFIAYILLAMVVITLSGGCTSFGTPDHPFVAFVAEVTGENVKHVTLFPNHAIVDPCL